MKSLLVPALLRGRTIAFAAVALTAMVATTAHATLYSSVTIATSSTGELTSPSYTGVSNQFSSETGGYNFVYAAGSVGGAPGAGSGNCGSVATCAPSAYGSGAAGVGMWAIPTNTTSLGANGAFLALDSDFNTINGSDYGEPVQDTVSGLTVGNVYEISFNAADTQQNTYSGPSEDYVTVCLDGVSNVCQSTPNVDDATESDTPWVESNFYFTADSTSETLTLLGVGGSTVTTSNVPAFALVDDLSITDTGAPPVPEPSSLMLLGTGLAGLGGFVRMRLKKNTATNL